MVFEKILTCNFFHHDKEILIGLKKFNKFDYILVLTQLKNFKFVSLLNNKIRGFIGFFYFLYSNMGVSRYIHSKSHLSKATLPQLFLKIIEIINISRSIKFINHFNPSCLFLRIGKVENPLLTFRKLNINWVVELLFKSNSFCVQTNKTLS